MQIKIEEEGEKVKTVESVFEALRQELEDSRENSHNLQSDLTSTKQELKLSRQEVDLLSVGAAGAGVQGVQELLDLSRSVASVRREYQEMRHQTVKEINKMKVEMAEKARQLSTACLEVYTDSQYIRDSQGNKVLVGDIKECWEKLERVKLEKKVEEERVDTLEKEKENLSRELRMSDRKLVELRQSISDLQREEPSDEADGERGPSRLGRLEAENEMLRSSLQDIASMVTAEDDLNPKSPGRPRPLVPGLWRPSSAGGRRSRSTDSLQVTAAVQAALNNKQTTVHRLQSSLASMKEKYDAEARSCQEWQEKAKEAAKELSLKTANLVSADKEGAVNKDMAEMLQGRLDTAVKETREVSEELSRAREEIVSLNVRMEESSRVKNVLESKITELKSSVISMESSSRSRDESLGGKEITIMKLKEEKKNLEEEVISLKERLLAVEKDQERLEMERTDKETMITEEKKIRSEANLEIRKMRIEETHLLEQIAQKDLFEKKLRGDIVTNETIITSLKSEILDYEKKLSSKDTDLTRLNVLLSDSQKAKDEIDVNLKQLKREKNDLSNQVTSISLRKDALEDEYVHIREEYQILKDQLDIFHKSFSITSDVKEELSDKLLQRERESKENEVRIRKLEADLEREMVSGEDLRLECESLEDINKDLQSDVEKKSESIKQLNSSIVSLKAKLFEANRTLSEYREKTEAEFEMEKKRLEKGMKKAKEEYNINLKDLEDELDLQKEKMERRRTADINFVKESNKAERERFEEEIEFLTQQVENLKARNSESFIMAENSRSTAEKLARTEEDLFEEKIRQLTSTVELLKKDLSFQKQLSQKKLLKEEEHVQELEYQVKSLQLKLDSFDDDSRSNKESLEKEIRKLKNEKLRFDQDTVELRMQLRNSENTIDDLKNKLQTLAEEKDVAESEVKNSKSLVESLEVQIVEKNRKIQEKILEKHKEAEVLEKRIEQYEYKEKVLQEEIEEVRETLEKVQIDASTSGNIQFLQSKISELNLELDLLRKRLHDSDGGQEREERTVAELRKKLHAAEFEKSKLENYLAELREQVELDTDTRDSQASALQMAVQEGRERERKLEDVRHSLEIELNGKNQEIQELILRLQDSDNKVRESSDLITSLEQSKNEQEAKITSISLALNQSGLGVSRSGTPVRGRVRLRSGEQSPDVDNVRSRIRELVVKVEKMEKERGELSGRIEMLKLANENLVLNSGRLEEEKESTEDKLRSCQLQLQKLESKVSLNDQSLAEKEESVEKLKLMVRDAEKKVKDLSSQLDDTNEKRLLLEDVEKELRSKERRAKLDSSKLGGSLREAEEELEKVQREKLLLGQELGRLHTVVREKDEMLQVTKSFVTFKYLTFPPTCH